MNIIASILDAKEIVPDSDDNSLGVYLLYTDGQPIRLDVMTGRKLARRKSADEKRGFRWECVFNGIPNSPRDVDQTLAKIDSLLNNYGVEVVRGDDPGQLPVLKYSNSGDSFNTTVCYDVKKRKWFVGDVGQWVEDYERSGRRVL